MKAEVLKQYSNITQEIISINLSLCEVCHLKRSKTRKSLTLKPIVHKKFNSRAQIYLIEMKSESRPSHPICYSTCFSVKDSFKSKQKCWRYFLYFGCTICITWVGKCFLSFTLRFFLNYSANGREFVNQIIKNLTAEWWSYDGKWKAS